MRTQTDRDRTRRSRRATPAVAALEPRCLLDGASATWIGQDGHDLAGPSSTLAPDDVQDIHIALSGLPAGHAITRADIVGNGGGEWMYNGPYGPWAAALVRTPGSTTADLYMDPYQVETGRTFWITLTYDDGSSATLTLAGGTADPNLRMPGTGLNVGWVGQDGQDWTGPGPDVGPDGIQDVHLTLGNLTAGDGVQSVVVTDPLNDTWESGLNPGLYWNAEEIPNAGDPTRADLYFNPDRDLSGVPLTVTVNYANGKTDHATINGGHTDPTLRMPTPSPAPLTWNGFTAQWVGQDGQDLVGPGDVHVALSGLPAGRKVVGALLNDPTRIDWSYAAPGTSQPDQNGLPLAFRASSTDPTKADVDFPPIRSEADASLTLRLILDDGTMLATSFAGGPADPGLKAAGPSSTSVTAHPGDDLNALAAQYGNVHLAAGTYNLSAPLVLTQPVAITADPGTTLLFSQAAAAPTWTAAIKIRASHVTLNGFAVRFAGPIRWNDGVSYGPAVIGTTDNFDPGYNQLLDAITLTNLDVQAPPASTSWEEAPRLMRLVMAENGVVSDNTLKGGQVEFMNGPWQVVGNTYQGTMPDTYSYGVFVGHYTHDVTIANNTAQPVGPSGKTWRFLVLTQYGTGDVIQDNTAVGLGPMDNDTVPSANAPEVILTESYQIHFEGMPSSLSADGRVLQVASTPGGPASAGDVVSILTGPQAGQWRRIAQAIGPGTYLLDTPLPAGSYVISISTGFVDETFQGNTIDSRGSTTAQDMVLAGNQFGVQVLDNHLLGGGVALQVAASATEAPVTWGWTHAPFLGATIAGNVFEDSAQGARIVVEHGPSVKHSDVGRVYFSGTLTNNVGVWSDTFLAQRAASGATGQPTALTIGDSATADPSELVLSMQGNQVSGPATVTAGPTVQVNAATLNGQATVGQGLVLPSLNPPAAPTGLRLVNDTGVSGNDGITSDAHLRFDTAPGVAGYEYRTSGSGTTYLPVTSPASFLPTGIVPGFNTVLVRAYDALGRRGPDAVLVFVYDASPGAGTGTAGGLALSAVYQYQVGGSGPFVPLGQATTWPQGSTPGASLPIAVRMVLSTTFGGSSLLAAPASEVSASAPTPAAPPSIAQATPHTAPAVVPMTGLSAMASPPAFVPGNPWDRGGPLHAFRSGRARHRSLGPVASTHRVDHTPSRSMRLGRRRS